MKEKLAIIVLLTLIMIPIAFARYSISIPFQVDQSGQPVSSAIVGINISIGTTCASPFYRNQTVSRFGRGIINVSSPQLIASRTYTLCFNATVGSNVIKGRTIFQSPVGDINVSSFRGWVNGSRARFNSFFLNNGSTFDVIYGRDSNNVTVAKNIVNNDTFTRLQIDRSNFTNMSSKFAYISNRTVTQGLNGTGWIGTAQKWFQYGFFNRMFTKTQCYTIDCTKYETYNGTHLVTVI